MSIKNYPTKYKTEEENQKINNMVINKELSNLASH